MNTPLLIILLMISGISWTQNVSDEFAIASTFNENGDPTINITDPDGMRQGEWLFENSNGDVVVLKNYESNLLLETKVFVNGIWRSNKDFVLDQSYNTDVRNEISNNGIDLTGNRQILVVCDAQGNLEHLSTFGNWTEAEYNDLQIVISNYLIHYQSNLNSSTLLFIQ